MKETAKKICEHLQTAGYKGVFAGGCVRDMCIGREAHDYDVATDATPETVERLFTGTDFEIVPIGKAFGVMMLVSKEGIPTEVATFRKDGAYGDARHPDSVVFSSMKEDASRRDFSMNGMFFDPVTEEMFDFVGGLEDISNQVIRFIGAPCFRIGEDPLRMMRAARFSAQLGWRIDTESFVAIKDMHENIGWVSIERVRDELTKMLISNFPSSGMNILLDTGLLRIILPELVWLSGCNQDPVHHPEGDVWEHTMMALDNIYPDMKTPALCWGVIMHDIGKPTTTEVVVKENETKITSYEHDEVGGKIASEIVRRMKMSNDERLEIVWLVENHMRMLVFLKMSDYKKAQMVQSPWFVHLLELARVDDLASCKSDLLDKIIQWTQNAPARIWKRRPCIDGHDLIKTCGIRPGPGIGKILEKLLEFEIEGRITSQEMAVAEAIQLAKNWGYLPTRKQLEADK